MNEALYFAHTSSIAPVFAAHFFLQHNTQYQQCISQGVAYLHSQHYHVLEVFI